uniref:RNA-directed RNA polymerase n=1 Tax=Hubei levi-like virus 7 TaxID=1922919 RepID=A0A1L3KIJ7_9VIRU|nr:hypothetical protein [Hubei levi-like virus 7]
MSTSRRRSADVLREARYFRAPSQTTVEAIFNFLSAIDTPKSLAVWLLYKNKEHDQLTSIDIDPGHYERNPYRFRLDLAAVSFLSKSKFLTTTFKKEEVAFKKFFKFEELCQETNNRFRHPSSDPLNKGPNVWLLAATKRKIERLLGDYSPDEFIDWANWGPGVSTLVKGEHVSAINKFHAGRGITRDLYSLVCTWFPVAYPSWHRSLSHSYGENYFIHEVGNVIVTVPKNSKTDRVIAIEPDINLWFQKAIGTMIRRRLRRVGIDLNDQTRNQQLARLGSKTLDLCTVDFSSASDSISLEVVRELLPPGWFQLLDTCRSKFGMLDSGPLRWQKFSSMGNGYTFELESLIFYAAAQACMEYLGIQGEISVFGDDVILPTQAFDLFSSYSEFLGFKVNPDKSFASGYFRESCGSYYFDGVDCKPLFLKEKLVNVESLYKLANGIRLLAHRYGNYRSCDSSFRDSWTALVLRIPEPLRLRVPKDAGDAGLISNFDEAVPTRARYGIEGYYYRGLVGVSVKTSTEIEAVLLARLWQPSTQAHKNTYALRGRSQRMITNSLIPRWYDLGEWW